MLLHNLKLVFRFLRTNKLYSCIIVLSLTIGFACTNVLISFLVRESGTDSFHSKHDRTFQVFSNDPFGGNGRISYIPRGVNEYIADNYKDVAELCLVSTLDGARIVWNNQLLQDATIIATDSSFLSVFDFPLLQGNRYECIGSGKLAISKEKAEVLFGSANALGEIVTLMSGDTKVELVVAAVIDETVTNSHIVFDVIIDQSIVPEKSTGGGSYVVFRHPENAESFQEKLNGDARRPGLIGEGKMIYSLNKLRESYFDSDNRMGFMKTRSAMFIKIGYVVCFFILFVAAFNFINLFLLFGHNRRKEIGIRKTLGISMASLLGFSVTEVAMYIVLSYTLSVIATFLLIPYSNSIFETTLPVQAILDLKVVTFVGLILFLLAFVLVSLSLFRQRKMLPVSLMTRQTSTVRFSKVLFLFQFVISAVMAICSITIIQQMDHLKNAPLGFNRNLIQVNLPDQSGTSSLQSLKQKLSQLPEVRNTTVCSGNPISGNIVVRYETREGKVYSPYIFEGDKDFLKTLDLTLLEGEIPSEVQSGKLVNEAFVREFQMAHPIGMQIPGTEDVISGVVKDFTCNSFKHEIPPVIISHSTDGRALLIDHTGVDLSSLLTKAEHEWKALFDDEFSYRVIQEDLASKYRDDTFFARIIISFSIICMVLSCFGLFALSWAVIQSRVKEIGIRKILGATVGDIANLLTIAFTKRIVLAFMLAAPIGYFLMTEWLSRFANRIELNAGIFIFSGLIVLLVALATLSIQTFKASLTNPVDELRDH